MSHCIQTDENSNPIQRVPKIFSGLSGGIIFPALNHGGSTILFTILNFPTGVELLSPVECLVEERDIIANLGENVTSQVFNDHVSNYCSLESSNIKIDRDAFIKTLDSYIKDPKIKNLPRKNLTRM